MKRRMSLLTIAALILGAPLMAQTPDGETPAQEGICDDLVNATPGLYGICVAFCEAQDCDFETFVSGQCEPPDPRLVELYDQLKGPFDPPLLPCLRSPCPCFTEENIQLVDPPFSVCRIDEKIPNFEVFLTEARNADFELARAQKRPLNIRGDLCDFAFRNDEGMLRFQTLFVTPEEHDICRELIIDWQDQTGGCPIP